MVFSNTILLPSRQAMRLYIQTNEEEKNPKHLCYAYPNGDHLKVSDSIASEMNLLPSFENLKQVDPEIYDLFWNYAMTPSQYLFNTNEEYAISLMKEVKSITDRNFHLEDLTNELYAFEHVYKCYND